MSFSFPSQYHDDDYQPYVCKHGMESQCDDCDVELDGIEIDKCLNCGRYKSSTRLDKYQVCKVGCVNPN